MYIESDHFKTLEELIDTIKMWVKNEEEFYDRWFGLNEMNILVKEIERLKEENTILKQTMSNNSLLINENAFLKERISKAIEYIEEKYDYILGDDTFLDHDERIDRKQINHIIEILKGVDKE